MLLLQGSESGTNLLLYSTVTLLQSEVQQPGKIVYLLLDLLPGLDAVFQPLELGETLFRILPVIPEVGSSGLGLDFAYLISDPIRVKDASRWSRFPLSAPQRGR